MEIFGYVCSAFCRNKAEASNMDIPEYENQSTVAQARFGKKVMRNIFAGAAVLAVLAGVWAWWEWVATVPKPIFSMSFQEKGYSGQARMNVPEQSIVLHGGRLARYDIKTKKEVWSHDLLDRKKIAENASTALEQMKVAREQGISNGADPDDWKLPRLDELTQNMIRASEASLALHVQGENVWVQFPEKLVRYDWQSGSTGKEVSTSEINGQWRAKGPELVSQFENDAGDRVVARLQLSTGEIKKEEFSHPKPAALVAKAGARGTTSAASQPAKTLPARPNRALASNQVLLASTTRGTAGIDPKAAARRYQNMPLPSKLALPAVLAANANQARLKTELNSGSELPADFDARALNGEAPGGRSSFLFAGDGFVELSVKVLETKTVERKVMKAPPKKSALDGEISTGNSMAAANELLNEIQRETVGDTVTEDISLYQVSLRKGENEWTGQVTGSPQFFPLQTVNLLVAGDTLVAFDKSLKKLWEGKLSSTVVGGYGYDMDEPAQFGQGPCVERGGRLYVFDQTVLTTYEKDTGKPIWRLPSVGTAGLFFDEQGHIYVNTTTASPESVKYSRQIDISSKTRNQIVKLEENSGKVLWRADGDGMISYLSGKFIYTVEMYQGDSEDGGGFLGGMKTGLEVPPHVRIKRLSPKNGRVLWEHYQARAPLDVQFDANRIELLFKKEVQVLKFMTL